MQAINLKSGIYRVLGFALPISSASLINILSVFIAMLMVAHLGKTELAAGALAGPTYVTLMTVFATILYSVGIVVSHQRGQGKSTDEIGRVTKNGLYLAFLLSLPAATLLWHADSVLKLFGQDPSLIAIAKPYFHYAAMAFFPSLFAGVIAQFHTGIGEPRFTLLSAIIRLPLIVILSYGFILGHFGLPQMGLAGLMCATFWVQSLYCVFLMFYCQLRPSLKAYRLFSQPLDFNPDLCRQLLSIGVPIGLQYGGELGAMTMATYMMGHFGVMALAASQMVSQYAMLLVMISLGLSQALSILCSEAHGRGDYTSLKCYFNATLTLLLGIFGVVICIYFLVPKALMQPYIDVTLAKNNDIVHLATYFFIISGMVMLVDGCRNVLSGALRGLHDSKAPMVIGIACLWGVALPMSYLFAYHLGQGPVGLRLGFSSGFVIAVLLLYRRFGRRLNALIEVPSTERVHPATI